MRALLTFCVMVMALGAPAHGSDPLRLRENFQVLELHPYLSASEAGGAIFSVQNGGSADLELVLTRTMPLDLMSAFAPQPSAPLRLFSSDDREFSAMPGAGDRLAFSVPAGQVQSFYLLGADASPVIYLWSPEGLSGYVARIQTFHAGLLFLLSGLLLLAIAMTIYRRSRRAVYALVMGGGLIVLLASLWMRDVLPNDPRFDPWRANRLLIIQASFVIGVAMSVLAHVNLVIRQIINRNYWTRVIIVTDIWLITSIALWAWQAIDPGYAGLLSSELGHIFMALTCASVLLGAVFVPDRRRA
jgi:hypothetical protein